MNNTYVQIKAKVTHVPLQIPFSLCLPKQCGSSDTFEYFMVRLSLYSNSMVDVAKSYLDFDALDKLFPEISTSNRVMRQVVQLINSQSALTFSAIVPKEDQ